MGKTAIVKASKKEKQVPPLQASMTCEAAFRTAATHYVNQVTAQQRGTSAGNADAVHAMRVVLTRLRATIALFSPMVEGDDEVRLGAELKWLNAHLGMVRDLDVALQRLAKIRQPAAVNDRPWKQERAACQRHLTRALRSQRYRRLIRDIGKWIEDGAWSRKRTKKAAERRARPAGDYCTEKLLAWRKKLLKRSRKLETIGTRKRHRIRLANKRLNYAIEAAASLAPASEKVAQLATQKWLRKAQKSLGQLNDDQRRRSLAAALGENKVDERDLLLDAKQRKRLLRKAVNAYDELARLEALRMSDG
jgi:CHAD domain-containing protein